MVINIFSISQSIYEHSQTRLAYFRLAFGLPLMLLHTLQFRIKNCNITITQNIHLYEICIKETH